MSGSPSTDAAHSRDDAEVDIEQLLSLFYSSPAGSSQLADVQAVSQVPPPFDQLLDHNGHMTVTVEAFYHQKVDVVVHRCERRGNWYVREITLVGSESKRVVQYGIVRLNINALDQEVWRRIESQEVPLGRVLIEHNVLREVQLCGLWRVLAGPALASLLRMKIGDATYGRTALIYCDGEPAIELLEIVTPCK